MQYTGWCQNDPNIRGWHLEGVQGGRHRRPGDEGHVGVPSRGPVMSSVHHPVYLRSGLYREYTGVRDNDVTAHG